VSTTEHQFLDTGGAGDSNAKRYILIMLGSVLVLLGAATIDINDQVQPNPNIESFELWVLAWGHWGVFAVIFLMVAHSFIPFPAEFVAIVAGMIYGAIWGTVVTWIGAMLGACIAFYLARKFGRPLVSRLVAKRKWQTVKRLIGTEGWKLVFFSRLIPVIAFNLINYVAGLTKISGWTFTWATGLGIIPLTVLMVLLGDQMDRLDWDTFALFSFAGLAFWAAFKSNFGVEATSANTKIDQAADRVK